MRSTSSARAVRKITGARVRPPSCLNSSKPLMSGKPTSRMINPGAVPASACRAAAPVEHHSGSKPSVESA